MEIENINKKYLNYNYEEGDEQEMNETYVYYKNTYIYGWGKNKYGELGLGNTENVSVPNPIKSLQNQEIIQVCSGGKHTAIITKDGKIYVCGADVLGLLGFESKKWKEQHKFQKLPTLDLEYIKQVACAEFHSLCLTNEGYVFAWGGNLHNKLGQINQAGVPMKINSLSNKKIVQISCGDHHSAALSENGEVFTWGGGGQYNRGQCGHGDLKDVDTPKRIEFFKNKRVFKVVCGGYHTIVLLEDNNLFGFGKGTYGQCGWGVSEDTSTPKMIKFSKKSFIYEQPVVNKNDITHNNVTMLNPDESMINNNNTSTYRSPVIIKDIKCGGEHTVILSSYGRVYAFGHGYTGQLGLGNTKNFDRPMIVKSLIRKTVNQIAAGWSHTMVLTSEGNLYVAGCGKYGELGLQDNENKKNFTLVRSASLLNITNIFAGGHHSWLITDNIMPERDDFEMPSPLEADNFSPTFQKSVDNSPKNLKHNSSFTANNTANVTRVQPPSQKQLNINLKYNLELLGNKIKKNFSKNILQVAYTDNKLSHRFVRFAVPHTSPFKDVSYKDLYALFEEYFKKDNAVIFFRLQDDNELNLGNLPPSIDAIFKDMKSNFKLLDLNSNKKSFSLNIIYNVDRNEKLHSLKLNIENAMAQNNIMQKNTTKSIYEIINLSEEDITNSQVEEILSNWVLEFIQRFGQIFGDENPRFLELRPNIFLV